MVGELASRDMPKRSNTCTKGAYYHLVEIDRFKLVLPTHVLLQKTEAQLDEHKLLNMYLFSLSASLFNGTYPLILAATTTTFIHLRTPSSPPSCAR